MKRFYKIFLALGLTSVAALASSEFATDVLRLKPQTLPTLAPSGSFAVNGSNVPFFYLGGWAEIPTVSSTSTLTNKTLSGNIATNLVSGSATVTLPTTTGTLATLAGSETLTNKTLSGNIATNLVSGAATITLPTTTGTLATLAGTETLTNKTLSGNIAVTLVSGAATVTLPTTTGTLATLANAETLTNKTIAGGSNTISGIANSMLSTVATATFKGRTTAGTGAPEDLTATQATALLNAFVGDAGSGGTKGLVPAPTTGDATKFLRGDGSFATPAGAGDVSSNTSSSVDSELVLFNSTTGKSIKRAAGTGAVSVASGVVTQGTLSIANGGTNSTATATAGGIGYGTGTAHAYSSAGTSGQMVISGGSGSPTYRTITAPSVQKFTSSSGTYTTPAGVLWLRVLTIGGGGGGGGSGGSGVTSGGAGGNTTFGSIITCNGGSGGINGASTGNGGAGGSASLTTSGTVLSVSSVNGSQGSGGAQSTTLAQPGGIGAGTYFAGGGGVNANTAGSSPAANTGAGAGGGGNTGSNSMGGGGGAGGFVETIITSPSATYTYAVGAGGTNGAAGSGGTAGGTGGSGVVIVEEHFQ